MNNTVVRMKRSTLNRLRQHGEMGDSWNDVIEKLLDQVDFVLGEEVTDLAKKAGPRRAARDRGLGGRKL